MPAPYQPGNSKKEIHFLAGWWGEQGAVLCLLFFCPGGHDSAGEWRRPGAACCIPGVMAEAGAGQR